jgi:cytochrome c oxidase subunit III
MASAGVVAEQFDDRPQQRTAAELGMWIFLGTELLFFGGLFLGYALYRHIYTDAFTHAGRETKVLIGTLNTGILLTSSLTVALAVKATKLKTHRLLQALLAITVALGIAFLALKLYEYHEDIKEYLIPGNSLFPIGETGAEIFFSFYWIMTGIHAVHMLVGIGTWSVVIALIQARRIDPSKSDAVEVAGLYWHFVDVIWIFLYPLLYLVGRA